VELERKHIEAIKYRLEKQGLKATHGQIKLAALNFETLDIDAIADRVAHDITYKSTPITSNSSQITRLPLPPGTKGSLVRVEAAQMGITLTESEVLQIIDSSHKEITDTAEFIIGVRELLKDFLYQRNQQLENQNQDLIGTVTQVINEANQDKARIIAETNNQLMDVVNECRQQSDDYKSPYSSRLQSMRETLQTKANNSLQSFSNTDK